MVSFRSLTTFFIAAAAAAHASSGVNKRGVLDVCVSVKENLGLVFGSHQISSPLINVSEELDLCLCIGLIPSFIQANAVAQVAAGLAGVDVVTKILTDLILGANGRQTCNYPDHSEAICSAECPCSFNCTDGFVKQGNQCACPSPNSVCNGKCSSQACPSAGAHRRRHLDARTACPRGTEACGVTNRGWSTLNSRSYECLNTRTALESCGGCATGLAGKRPTGVDCGSLPHVNAVSCNGGKCFIETCKKGFKPSPDHLACLKK